MNKKELYELALSDVHKYNLLNEIFAIRDTRVEKVDYTIGVNGYISLDVLNQHVNKINENTNLRQALNEIREYINSEKFFIRMDEPQISVGGVTKYELVKDDISQIIDKVLGDEKSEYICKQKSD